MEGKSREVVVLTGASGCLGFHTLRLLLSRCGEEIAEVRCLDLRKPEELMKKILDEERDKLNKLGKKIATIKWVEGDIRDVNVVEQTLIGTDCVIHCAAKIDLWNNKSDQDQEELSSINVAGTENLLKASVQLGVHKFIHISSFEVYFSYDTIYYATEATLPNTKWFLFGASATTKKEAEEKVKQYSNSKLSQSRRGKDSLNAVIMRFPVIYGEFDRYFVSKILEATKFFGGTLRRLDHIWIRQQPIYAANAAWALISAMRRLDKDQSISGEEFHITDETPIGDSFDFVEPYLKARGMHVTKNSLPFLPILLLLILFFTLKKCIAALDFFGLFTNKKGRLQEAIERDKHGNKEFSNEKVRNGRGKGKKRWYDYITPQTTGFMCNSSFLNRTKASLRLDYEPIVDPDEARERSIDWYTNHLSL